MRATRFIGLVLLLPVFPGAQADSDGTRELYQWKDEQGVVHFSDQRPANPASPVTVQPLPPLSSSPPPEDDRYSVMNQSRRFEEEHRQREEARRQAQKQRLEHAKLEAELEAARAQLKRLEEEQQGPGYPGYLYAVPPSRRPVRPGYRPARPGYRVGPSGRGWRPPAHAHAPEPHRHGPHRQNRRGMDRSHQAGGIHHSREQSRVLPGRSPVHPDFRQNPEPRRP
jgi:hypothetical protein